MDSFVDCERCGSPRKGVQCRYWWYSPHREAARAGGWDPPCYGDEYDKQFRERSRRDVLQIVWGFAGMFAVIAIIVWIFQ